MGTLITYSSVLGRWPTIEQLHGVLRKLRRRDVVMRLAQCNALTRPWEIPRTNEADKQAREYVLPSWAEDFNLWTKKFGDGFVFLRFPLLWLMRQAFVVCMEDGAPITTRKRLQALGEACLMANDLTVFTTPKTLPTALAVAANWMPHADYFSQEDHTFDIARTVYLLTELAPSDSRTNVQSLPERIQKFLGYSVTEYVDLAFACAILPMTAITEDVKRFRIPSLSTEAFAATSIPQTVAERFLLSISADEHTFHTTFLGSDAHSADLTLFRDRPFLRTDRNFIPVDPGFVLDKAGRSLFWTALKNCKNQQEREAILRDWGSLFEIYVNRIIGENLEPSNGFIASPSFNDGAQAFDGCVLEGTTLIVFEALSRNL